MAYKVLEDGTIEERGDQPVRVITVAQAQQEIKSCNDAIEHMQSEIARLQAKVKELSPVKTAAEAK